MLVKQDYQMFHGMSYFNFCQLKNRVRKFCPNENVSILSHQDIDSGECYNIEYPSLLILLMIRLLVYFVFTGIITSSNCGNVDLDGLNCFCSMKNMMPKSTLTQEDKNYCYNEVSTIFVDTVDDNLVSECGTSLQYLLGSCECGDEGNQIDKDRCSYNHYVPTSPADERFCDIYDIEYGGCSWDGESCVWNPLTMPPLWMLSAYDVNAASCSFLEKPEECNDKVLLKEYCGDIIHKGNPGNICSEVEEENCDEKKYFLAKQCTWQWKDEYNSVFQTCCEVDDSIIETNWDGQVFCESAGSYDYVVDGAIVFLNVLGMELNCDFITNYSLDDRNYRILNGIPGFDMTYILEKCCVPRTSSPTIVQPTLSPSEIPSTYPSTSLNPSSIPTITPTTTISPSRGPSIYPTATLSPSQNPSPHPTISTSPSDTPTFHPTVSFIPSDNASLHPSTTSHPSLVPSMSPTTTTSPSGGPSFYPTTSPSQNPSPQPSISLNPSLIPSLNPTISTSPSDTPTFHPTASFTPSDNASLHPSTTSHPSLVPTITPTTTISPSRGPSIYPTATLSPSQNPSPLPSTSLSPTSVPSLYPTISPTYHPTMSLSPSENASLHPSTTSFPSVSPTFYPSTSTHPSIIPSVHPSTSLWPSVLQTIQPIVSLSPSRADIDCTDPSCTFPPTLIGKTKEPSTMNHDDSIDVPHLDPSLLFIPPLIVRHCFSSHKHSKSSDGGVLDELHDGLCHRSSRSRRRKSKHLRRRI